MAAFKIEIKYCATHKCWEWRYFTGTPWQRIVAGDLAVDSWLTAMKSGRCDEE